MVVDPGRRAAVNLIAPTGDEGGHDEALRGFGQSLTTLGLPVRWVSLDGTLSGLSDGESVPWSGAEPLAVSPHDVCACVDEVGAALARRVRRAIAGPAFVYLALDPDYLRRYGQVRAASPHPEHWPIASDELAQAFPGGVRDDAAVFIAPSPALDPGRLSARLAGRERRLGLVVAGEPEAAFAELGLETVQTARERGAFADRSWSFARLRPGAFAEPLFDDGPLDQDRAAAGLDLCLRLGEGRPGLSPRRLAAAGCVVVSERSDPVGRWPASRPVFADLVHALEAAVASVEDGEARLRVASAAADGAPADWSAAFAPHAALLRRAFARTLAASRRA